MLISSLQIEWYAAWPTLTWPDLWPLVKLWPWLFKVTLDIIRSVLTRGAHRWQNVALGLIVQKLLQKNIYAKNWWLTSVNFDLWSLSRWPEVKSKTTSQIRRFIAQLLIFPLVAIYHSLGSRAAQLEPCTFDEKMRTFCDDDVIWP